MWRIFKSENQNRKIVPEMRMVKMAGSVVLLVAGWRSLGIKLIDRCAQLTRQFRSLGCSLEVHKSN